MERHANPEDPDLYALGALDGEEKQAYEAHLRACPACARELEAARQRVALLGLAAAPVAPPASLRQDLMQRAREGRPAAPARPDSIRPAPVPSAPPRRRIFWLTPALATATIVLAAVAAWLGVRDRSQLQQIDALRAQLAVAQIQSREIARASEQTDHILGMPGTIHVALSRMPGEPQGRAGVLYNARMGMVTCAGQLGPAPPDKSYQLWLVPASGAPMSLGVMSSMEPVNMLTAHVPPGMVAKAFAVTMEPRGGMPHPTGPKVLVGVAS